jgi:phage/plasmid-like protein (TIGR03299 family)
MDNLNEKVFDLLENTGLNWSVSKNQLVDLEGHATGSYGIFKGGVEWLGTVGDRYEMLQNHELAETLIQATDGLGIEITRGGMLYKGVKTYLQAELPEEYVGKSNVKRWITCLNSHDGSTSVGFGSSNTVVICENTFFKAFGELQKFRHTASMKQRIEIAQNDLRNTIALDNQLMTNFKRMADLPLKDEIVERVLAKMFKVKGDQKTEEISTRKENQIKAFAGSLTRSITEQGQTVWALFNGVTRYVNHIAAPSDPEKKKDFLMSNGGLELSNIGFNEIMNWVTENTAELVLIEK